MRPFPYLVQGSGLRVQHHRVHGSPVECRVQGLGFRFLGSEFRVESLGFRVQDSGFGCQEFRIRDSGFRM